MERRHYGTLGATYDGGLSGSALELTRRLGAKDNGGDRFAGPIWGEGDSGFEEREEVNLARTVKVRGRQEWVGGLQAFGSHCPFPGELKTRGAHR